MQFSNSSINVSFHNKIIENSNLSMCFTEGRNTRNKIGMSVTRRHEGGWDEGGWDPNGTSAL